ncbi:MAG: zf-HC2 domain-containing protein [Acidimicrobiia bacterium]
MTISCEQIQQACSAQMDGELLGVPSDALRVHLARCVTCRQWAADISATAPMLRLHLAEEIPDQAAMILDRIRAIDSLPVRRWRWPLVVIGLVQMLAALPELFAPGGGIPAHDARHLAAVGLACAFCCCFIAAQPHRAQAIAPVFVVLTVLLLGLSAIDVAAGRALATDEVRHGIAVIGAGLVWYVGRISAGTRSQLGRLDPLPSRA